MRKSELPIRKRVSDSAKAVFLAANAALFAEQGVAHTQHVQKPVTEERDPMHEAAAFNHMEKRLRDQENYNPNEGRVNEESVG